VDTKRKKSLKNCNFWVNQKETSKQVKETGKSKGESCDHQFESGERLAASDEEVKQTT